MRASARRTAAVAAVRRPNAARQSRARTTASQPQVRPSRPIRSNSSDANPRPRRGGTRPAADRQSRSTPPRGSRRPPSRCRYESSARSSLDRRIAMPARCRARSRDKGAAATAPQARHVDDPPVEQRGRPENEQPGIDDIRQEVAALSNADEPDQPPNAECRANAPAARGPAVGNRKAKPTSEKPSAA